MSFSFLHLDTQRTDDNYALLLRWFRALRFASCRYGQCDPPTVDPKVGYWYYLPRLGRCPKGKPVGFNNCTFDFDYKVRTTIVFVCLSDENIVSHTILSYSHPSSIGRQDDLDGVRQHHEQLHQSAERELACGSFWRLCSCHRCVYEFRFHNEIRKRLVNYCRMRSETVQQSN